MPARAMSAPSDIPLDVLQVLVRDPAAFDARLNDLAERTQALRAAEADAQRAHADAYIAIASQSTTGAKVNVTIGYGE